MLKPLNKDQALKEITKIARRGNLVRIYVDGGDCGAWEPATARNSVERDFRIRPEIILEIRECKRTP